MGLAAVGLIGTVASTGLSIYSQHQQAKAAEQAAEYNNTLAQREASNRELETAQGIARQRANDRASLAELRTRLASNGTVTTSGTPLTLMGETAGRLELSIADAARRANMEASSLRAQGKMGLWEAGQQRSAANLSMLATGIKGITRTLDMYQQGSYQGVNYGIP